MNSVILDASALLAVLRGEPGNTTVIEHMGNASISSVNLCEVFYKTLREGAALEKTKWAIDELPLNIVNFDDEQATVAATLHQPTYKLGISFADRACLALGLSRNLPVLTSDGEWTKLKVGVEVIKIR